MRQVYAGVGAILLSAGLALGQYALGDGHALDRNSRVGGEGINSPTRDLNAEIRFRNALVTGNVPGGMGFRGITGYGLEYDFRGRVGSDDLFSFRRDSFTSGLAGTGIRGTEALQYQFALTTGNQLPRNLRGSLLTSRTGERVTLSLPSNPVERGSGDVDVRRATAEELGQFEPGTLLSLRSISAFRAGRSLGPSMLTMVEGPEGSTQGLVSSPLRGLARERLLGDSETSDELQENQPGDRLDREPGDPSLPQDGSDETSRRGVGGLNPAPGLGVIGDLRERLSMDFAARAPGAEATEGEDPSAEPEGAAAMRGGDPFLEQLASLQRVLREGEFGASDPVAELGAEGGEGAATPGVGTAMSDHVSGWKELVVTLKQGAGTVEVPAPKLDRASAYDLHVSRAKDMLSEGRFFEAEQRFTMALAARPGDAIASIGRVHAQIGAGLDLSAAVNLKAFLVEHPEFVGAKYEPDLLPSDERLAVASRRLTEQLTGEGADRARRETALLLAYVSFHRGDRPSTVLALERLGEGAAGRRDPLTPLLRAVWLDDDAEAETDAGAGVNEEQPPAEEPDGQ